MALAGVRYFRTVEADEFDFFATKCEVVPFGKKQLDFLRETSYLFYRLFWSHDSCHELVVLPTMDGFTND